MTALSNTEIEALIQSGELILGADIQMVEGASYQLRTGSVYYDLTESGKRIQLSQGEAVLIKPGHRVVIITAEQLVVPANILVRVVSKGSLFSVGLTPVATYADPGFSGNLGIVTENVSDKYIELPQGEPIAKADFTQLETAATKLYRGQHGFQAGIWPIKTHLQKEHHEVARDQRVGSEKDEALALLPAPTRMIIRRIELTQIWTNVGLLIAILLNSGVLFLINGNLIDNFYGIVGNLVASSIIGFAAIAVSVWRRNI